MQKHIANIILTICFVALLTACKTETQQLNLSKGYDYFPIDSGFWTIHEVDSIVYDNFIGEVDSFTTQVKEVYGESFMDNEGNMARLLYRYVRYEQTESWDNIVPIVWYALLDTTNKQQGIRMEGELRHIKLVFPIRTGKTWLGNGYYFRFDYDGISLPACRSLEWPYEYEETTEMYMLNNLVFDETVSILQKDCEDGIDKVYSTERYAKGVGLIEKEQWVLTTGDSTNPLPWPERAENGHIVRVRILDYKQ